MTLVALERLLRDHGLALVRQESSHRIYGDDHGARLVVACHNRRPTTPLRVVHRELRRLRESG
jgi:predicted RNA binding protein YcfA (HicA-like mRNA interferase family)